MISIVLLLKILGVMCLAAGWVGLWLYIRRTVLRLERLHEQCEERLDALEELMGPARGADTQEPERAEERRKALEAERRFTEGIASILNFSHTPVPGEAFMRESVMPGDGRKGD
jgi:hypothetical protein